MIQTINPYSSARTAEIMSRYRPIAPKPEADAPSINGNTQNGIFCDKDQINSIMPQGLRNSAYLRDVWAHLQARPTRTRKRGRSAAFPPPPMKRPRSGFQGISSLPAKNLAMHGFSLVPINCNLDAAVTTLAESVALPLIRYTSAEAARVIPVSGKGIDLNVEAEESGPKELDFMPQLKQPVRPNVITPQPVRPVGSTIVVKRISGSAGGPTKRTEEVEKEIEGDTVPAIMSDSYNKVRATNAAYKEMVGQPECCWLDCVAACKRIGGEVSLRFCGDSEAKIVLMNGFRGEVKIAWEIEGKKRSVDGFCDVEKVGFGEKNCRLLWRFHASDDEPKNGSHSDTI